MCGIAGIMGTDISKKLHDMLISLKHRGPDGSGAFVNGNLSSGNINDLKIQEGSFGLGHDLLSIVGCESGSQPLIYDNYVLVCNGEIYNFRELKNKFNINFRTDSDCEIIISLIKMFYNGSLYDAVIKTIGQLDGDYAFAVYDGKHFAAVRDPVGVKPLYFGENNGEKIFAFASEKKALWKIGINDVKTLPPDSMIYNKELVKINNKLNEIQNLQNKSNLSKEILKKQLKDLLITSVKKRISGLSEIGILFSGGIDSTIIAKITDDLGIKTCLYSVGHENSADLKFARETADKMNLPLKTKVVNVEDVRKYLPLVLDAIEEFNIMKIGVGMPAYIAAEMAHEDNLKVMLSGQGADELFGGYNRYLKFYEEKGERAQEDLKKDILNLYHVNLQRDDAVTMANSIELRVPYLDPDIINIAMNIPMKYKINKDNSLRKCILREVGAELGVPEEIVKRPKKAAQYGSGIHKMLVKKVLKEESFKDIENKFKYSS
ncbi:asparagine synthase (glutamine-hydrolyzing) [Methanobacterium sp.]|uniref:asparagine synthase (glutamine-hydrolyzing) n=1 Tax=Methanobacterium sp. TaxID=2164 RepID=UPI003C77932A